MKAEGGRKRKSGGQHQGAAVKKGWQTTQLSAVAAVQSGAGFPDRYQGQSDGEIPFYKVSDMNIAGNEREMVFENNSITEETRRELGAFLFPQGSTIFPKIGGAIATNKKRLTTRDCCVDNNVMGVIPKPGKINSEFLFYFFLAHDLSEFANEAHLPSIRKTVVEDWPIILPVSLADQQRIVGLLDEAFEGLATAKASAEKNLQNARALFESHLQSVFTQRGPGWLAKRLEDIADADCSLSYGIVQPGEEFDEGMPIVRPTDLTSKVIRLTGLKRIDPKLAEGYKRTTLQGGELLLCVRGSTGVISIASTELVGANVTRGIVPIRFNRSLLLSEFGFHLLSGGPVQRQIREKTYGTALMQINIRDLRLISLSIPPLNEQRAIAAKLDSLYEETQRLARLYERKLAALEALKKSLLHQAFSGEL